MGLLGALFGGGVGFMLGGPIGAMLGGALGASMGQNGGRSWNGQGAQRVVGRCPGCRRMVSFGPGETLVCPHCRANLSAQGEAHGGSGARTQDQSAQSAFMVALISLAAKVAKADGQVTPDEVRAFDTFLRTDLGMSSSDRQLAGRIFNRARDSGVPAADFARQLRGLLGGQPDRLRDLVSLLLKVAWADGRLHPAEESLIREIAGHMGLTTRDYEEARALFSRGNSNAAYAILGLDASATDEEVKKSYRRLAREYHPDVLASKDLPEDFTAFANEKLQAINEAYHSIKKNRGF